MAASERRAGAWPTPPEKREPMSWLPSRPREREGRRRCPRASSTWAGGTPVQVACGFEDSVDDLVRYLIAACGPEPDAAKVVAYAEASLDHSDGLVARRVGPTPGSTWRRRWRPRD